VSGNGKERRRYPRFQTGVMYTGHGPDGEVQGQATNQGPGGAFLHTTEPIRMKSKLILTVHDPFEKEQPVFLVAVVVHSRKKKPVGVGIRWKKAICRFGLKRLRQFLEAHFHQAIDPHKTGAFREASTADVVAYDFEFGTVEPVPEGKFEELLEAEKFYGVKFPKGFLPKAQYLEVKLKAAGAESRHSRGFRRELSMDAAAMLRIDRYGPGETSTQPITVDRVENPGLTGEELDQWKYEMRKRKRTAVPVSMTMQGKTFGGTVKNISEDAVLVVTVGIRPAKGDRALIEMPITVGTRSTHAVILGDVTRIARDKNSGHVGIDLKIRSIDEKGEDGLFQDYLRC